MPKNKLCQRNTRRNRLLRAAEVLYIIFFLFFSFFFSGYPYNLLLCITLVCVCVFVRACVRACTCAVCGKNKKRDRWPWRRRVVGGRGRERPFAHARTTRRWLRRRLIVAVATAAARKRLIIYLYVVVFLDRLNGQQKKTSGQYNV